MPWSATTFLSADSAPSPPSPTTFMAAPRGDTRKHATPPESVSCVLRIQYKGPRAKRIQESFHAYEAHPNVEVDSYIGPACVQDLIALRFPSFFTRTSPELTVDFSPRGTQAAVTWKGSALRTNLPTYHDLRAAARRAQLELREVMEERGISMLQYCENGQLVSPEDIPLLTPRVVSARPPTTPVAPRSIAAQVPSPPPTPSAASSTFQSVSYLPHATSSSLVARPSYSASSSRAADSSVSSRTQQTGEPRTTSGASVTLPVVSKDVHDTATLPSRRRETVQMKPRAKPYNPTATTSNISAPSMQRVPSDPIPGLPPKPKTAGAREGLSTSTRAEGMAPPGMSRPKVSSQPNNSTTGPPSLKQRPPTLSIPDSFTITRGQNSPTTPLSSKSTTSRDPRERPRSAFVTSANAVPLAARQHSSPAASTSTAQQLPLNSTDTVPVAAPSLPLFKDNKRKLGAEAVIEETIDRTGSKRPRTTNSPLATPTTDKPANPVTKRREPSVEEAEILAAKEEVARLQSQLHANAQQSGYALKKKTDEYQKEKAKRLKLEADQEMVVKEGKEKDARLVAAEEALALLRSENTQLQESLKESTDAKTSMIAVAQRYREEEARAKKELEENLAYEREACEIWKKDAGDAWKELRELKEKLKTVVEEKEGLLGALEREGNQRLHTERLMADMRREANMPFIVPAMLQAFEKLAHLSSNAMQDKDKAH
ncbi:hypothetical protein BXZ70DRAFT_716706 [Cristinia sonorae]|uniref:Uncharacterized protein n=1 Tax=Cristinia sonorae TaxID=1940300 RepID=A0A8K0USG1_9AGAR|nr:hypothetical protein BXZ70DRAFT_716706 [Cristinia sonorae]